MSYSSFSTEMYGRQIDPKQRCTKHKFDREIIRKIAKYLDGNNYDGIMEVIEDWSIVTLSIIITIHAYKISLFTGIISYSLALVIIGGRQRAIADILHQASHGAAAKNPYLNWILGTIFSGYAVFQSFSIYTESHVKLHHPYLGNPHKDPDYIGHISNGICGINRNSVTTSNYIFSLMSPSTSWAYLKYLVKNRIFDKNEPKSETMVRFIYWVLILGTLYHQQCFVYFILFWIIPLITSNVWIGSLLELLEHFPMIDDPNVAYIDILITKNRIWSKPVDFILGTHNEGYHLVHHLFPKLPSWHYKEVHNILMEDKIYAILDHAEEGCWNMITQVIRDSDPKHNDVSKKGTAPTVSSQSIGHSQLSKTRQSCPKA